VAVWSLATLATGLTANFGQLFATRAVLGIGEASYYPAGTSLLGDYFPRHLRGRTMAIWSAGSAFGIAAGFAGGGLLAARFGWRVPFFITAAPGLVFALLAFRLREPLRGAAEERGPRLERTREASLSKMFALLTIRSLRWTILAQTVLFFVLGANAFWLPTLLTRRFGLSIGEAGFVTVALAAPAGWFVPAFLLAVVCLYFYTGPFAAICQNVVAPSMRASAVTVTLLIAHLLGDSYAAAAVGLLSDAVGGLQTALLIVSPILLLVAAGLATLALRSIQADAAAMDRQWTEGSSTPVHAVPI